MSLNSIVGDNIKKIREGKGISQADLAKKMKIGRSYVSSLEKGLRNPSLLSLEKVAAALSVEPISLLEQSQKNSFEHMQYLTGLISKKTSRWKNKKWYHQRFDGSPYLIHMIAEAQIITRKKEKGAYNFTQNFCFFEDGKADWYIDTDDLEKVSSAVLQKGKTNPHIGKELIREWQDAEDLFYKKCQEIEALNLRSFSDSRLISLHDDFVDCILDRNSSSSIIDGFALDTDQLLEDKLKSAYAKSPIKKEMTFPQLFAKLTTPTHTSFVRQAEIDLMELILRIDRDKKNARKYIEEYRDKYFWIRNNYVDANVLTVDYFEQEITQIRASALDIKKELQNLREEVHQTKKEKEDILRVLTPDKETLLLLETTEEFTFWQDERKKATLFTAHYALLILNEIAARVNIPVELIKYMSPREVSTIFVSQPSSQNLLARKHGSVFYWDGDGHEAISGAQVHTIKKELLGERELLDVQDFRGMTAALGKVSGIVRVLKSVKDIHTIKQGEVLVAVMTRPDYVPAMKKACAIVTDEGGITSHAAIVSRELKIPCIIGTKIATQVLKDGDLVEVNANHGLVKILKKS